MSRLENFPLLPISLKLRQNLKKQALSNEWNEKQKKQQAWGALKTSM